MAERAQIIVKGIVQGVGFRPFVYTLADSLDCAGYVTNTEDGVLIDVEGDQLSEFIRKLRTEAPPLSRITDVSITRLPAAGHRKFSIRQSKDKGNSGYFTLVSPDVSICPDCLRELLDPADRRYLYPFINCTNCGPRYTITKSIPYDRPNTTMAPFAMCPDCKREYHDPKNRRFHAQPNACAVCGPQVEFKIQNKKYELSGHDDPLISAIQVLEQGGIVAVKGLGGFHLACDAMNDQAVRRLRERKRRSNKPFAVMCPDLDASGRICHLSEQERGIIQSNLRPIVLLRKRQDAGISQAVSPGNGYVGVMLPYTPLHYLLFHRPHDNEGNTNAANFTALVMTSGNLSEEPIVRDNEEAMKKLHVLVDGFLTHNRDIFMRVDDSVVRIDDRGLSIAELEKNDLQSAIRNPQSALSFVRRSRGYAPDPIPLHDDGPEVMGCGADLKNTFTLTKGSFAIPSQHIGDMENYETLRFYEECLRNLKSVYRADPQVIVHDLHPGYLSTRWALEQGSRVKGQGSGKVMQTVGIQHHYAHIGSVMAEHGLKEKVIGVALDGTGYGLDGNLWGGEFLIADIEGFERAGQFAYFPLPGGDAAIREPWRTAVGAVRAATGDEAMDYLNRIAFNQKYGQDTIGRILTIADSRELSPLASGAGRLFDAISALLGICDANTFEGEAAMALESHARDGVPDEYRVEFHKENRYTVVDYSPVIKSIMEDTMRGIGSDIVAAKFHNTVASVIVRMVGFLSAEHGISDVALSGGTFQNLYLLRKTIRSLEGQGVKVFLNRNVPCNDAGISLGQAYLVRERLKRTVVRGAEQT